jgi:hypothetical protein
VPIRTPSTAIAATAPGYEPRFGDALHLHIHAQCLTHAFDDALDVEVVNRPRAAAPVIGANRAGPGKRQRSSLAARPREAGADLEQPHVPLFAAAIVRDRSDQPGQHDGLSTAKLSDKGLAIGTRSLSAANGAAAGSDTKPKVTASENPTPVMIARNARACAIRGSIGGGGVVSAGNVTGMRSNP